MPQGHNHLAPLGASSLIPSCSLPASRAHVYQAEYLGDRVAVMSGGRLRIQGSPLELKTHFGLNYELVYPLRLHLARPHSLFSPVKLFFLRGRTFGPPHFRERTIWVSSGIYVLPPIRARIPVFSLHIPHTHTPPPFPIMALASSLGRGGVYYSGSVPKRSAQAHANTFSIASPGFGCFTPFPQ